MATKKDSLLDQVVLLGSSLAYLTKETTDELIDVLERNNVISTKEGRAAVEKVKTELKTRREDVKKVVVNQLSKAVDELGLATKKDLDALKKKPAPRKKSAK